MKIFGTCVQKGLTTTRSVAISELKRCPFCGGKPYEDATICLEYGGHEHQDYSIKCSGCGAEVTVEACGHTGDVPCSCCHDTQKMTKDKWNKRSR